MAVAWKWFDSTESEVPVTHSITTRIVFRISYSYSEARNVLVTTLGLQFSMDNADHLLSDDSLWLIVIKYGGLWCNTKASDGGYVAGVGDTLNEKADSDRNLFK
ncbi:hypothetical protein EVAR_61464_1 [Eumeta japonica]|uniref:Uncharacterized protein n=1 Tax=Eumeta variegata TaxID=151549 RepID=A0A4C1Z618_EUMVA|nr:hypothetical protein EVAR_61464_1 [Eumeta japonica]